MMRVRILAGSLLCVIGLLDSSTGQSPTPAPALTPAQIVDKTSPAVAMVLATQAPGETNAALGAALVIYADGDLLTSWHLIKNAYAVQVRFKSGEVFDRVKLLGFDERRDIAAIRITASGLPILPVASAADANPGDPVVSIFHPQAQPWSTSTGIVTAYRLADEIPGAGTGFRVLQFTAPASPGANGGVLIDAKGRALGLITGSLDGGQSLNFAVPIENVSGLADTVPVKSFANGSQLLPPHPGAPPAPVAPASPTPVSPAQNVQPAAIPALQPSEKLVPASPSESLSNSRDREFFLHHFKTMYVDAHAAKYFGSDDMKAILAGNQDFNGLNITIVDDPKIADTILIVSNTFVWDFPFELKHQASSIVLLAGKGVGPLSGHLGAINVASVFVKAAKPYRTSPPKP
jgi:S1-C subfamily serine protease